MKLQLDESEIVSAINFYIANRYKLIVQSVHIDITTDSIKAVAEVCNTQVNIYQVIAECDCPHPEFCVATGECKHG